MAELCHTGSKENELDGLDEQGQWQDRMERHSAGSQGLHQVVVLLVEEEIIQKLWHHFPFF